MRLIDADELKLRMETVEMFGIKGLMKTAREMVIASPTVDAIEVVRCRDCKHRDPEDHKCDSGALERAGCVFPVGDDYFCAFGERKEDERK